MPNLPAAEKPLPIDHVAVPSNDIARGVDFYVKHFKAEVLYQDETWAFLQMGDVKLALVTPTQHPPHVALAIDEEQLDTWAAASEHPVDTHRDGTKGIYLKDPDGNAIELICYPEGKTPYEK